MLRFTKKQIDNYFIRCISEAIPYRDYSTNSRHTIKSDGLTIISKDSKFIAGELFFIKTVKADIKKLELYDNKKLKDLQREMKNAKVSAKQIKYIQYSPAIKQNINIGSCREIDISAAYWQTAYQLGLITDKLYQRAMPMTWDEALEEKIITRMQYKKCLGLTPAMAAELGIIDKNTMSKVGGISKLTRLASIGSLAKREVIRKFTGRRWYVLWDERDPLAYLWDIICYKVSTIMQEAASACGDDFIMFWVDAIFIKRGCEDKVHAIFEKHGYTFKQYYCENVHTTEKELIIKSKAKAKKLEDGSIKDTRVFQLPRANKVMPEKPPYIIFDKPSRNGWCHVTAESIPVLHAFAAKIGLKKSSYENKTKQGKRWQPHYDMKQEMIPQAITAGAHQVSNKQLLDYMQRHFG